MGTSELYRVVEALPEVMDSLVVDLEFLGRESWMPLFVVLRPGHELDAALTERIKSAIRSALSARHSSNRRASTRSRRRSSVARTWNCCAASAWSRSGARASTRAARSRR